MEKEKFLHYLNGALSLKASDIHLKVGDPPIYRIQKILRPTGEYPLTSEDTRDICRYVL